MNFMKQATLLGYKANSLGEVPIGAIIVKNDKIIARAHNTREKDQIATHHAEILAIEKACKKLKSWRLDDCDIYVTLEPCPMCAGAIVNARIKNLFFAVKDSDNGGITKYNILKNSMNHTTNTSHASEYETENKKMIQSFFRSKRTLK